MNTNLYLWIKAFHVISMVAWFAGLFYIFRLFVYHVKFKSESQMQKVYELMENKLLRIIMAPAMVLTIFFGALLIYWNRSLLEQGWMHAKLFAVVLLIAYHAFAVITARKFKEGNFYLSEKACRLINEVPTILLMLIVILVIVKPF